MLLFRRPVPAFISSISCKSRKFVLHACRFARPYRWGAPELEESGHGFSLPFLTGGGQYTRRHQWGIPNYRAWNDTRIARLYRPDGVGVRILSYVFFCLHALLGQWDEEDAIALNNVKTHCGHVFLPLILGFCFNVLYITCSGVSNLLFYKVTLLIVIA